MAISAKESIIILTITTTTFREEDFEAIVEFQGLLFLLPDFVAELQEDFTIVELIFVIQLLEDFTVELIFVTVITTPLPLLLLIFMIDVLVILIPFILNI